MPLVTFVRASDLKEHIGVVQLPEVAEEEKRQEKGEAARHPRLEALNGRVHLLFLAQRSQPIQGALLIVVLQQLYEA